MDRKEILQKIIEVISESCGIEEGVIHANSTLFTELGVNSIDMLDILFTLEMEYDVTLSISDIEKESKEEMEGRPFEVENVITAEGLEILRKRMPEIPEAKIVQGVTINNIISLITVESLLNMVTNKLENKRDEHKK